MSNRQPTAEEVLELYLAIKIPVNSQPNYNDWIKAKEKAGNDFLRAVKQWENAKGPVTHEWFVERFGSTVIYLDEKTAICYIDHGICILIQDDIEDRSLSNITCDQIETLIRVLGGEV